MSKNPYRVQAAGSNPFVARIPNQCELADTDGRCDQPGRHLCDHCLALTCARHMVSDGKNEICQRCAWNKVTYGAYDEPAETDSA